MDKRAYAAIVLESVICPDLIICSTSRRRNQRAGPEAL